MTEIQTMRVEIAKLALAPGDVLVVKVDGLLTTEQQSVLKKMMSDNLPEGIKYMILCKGLSLAVLTRADIDQRAA